jgi:hypothetical protein
MFKIAALLATSTLTFGDVLFSQQPLSDVHGLISNSQDQKAAEIFQVAEASQIQAVRWSGFFIPAVNDPASMQFRISFHTGTRLTISENPFWEAVVKPTVATQTVPAFGDPQFPLHSLRAVLPTPVFVEGTQPYWISIVDVTSGSFQWRQGQDLINTWASKGGPGREEIWVVSESLDYRTGLHLTLDGVSVPEPKIFHFFALAGALWVVGSKPGALGRGAATGRRAGAIPYRRR